MILCVNRGWGWSIENLSSQWWTCCVDAWLFPPPLKHCDWASMIGVSVLIKGHSRTESTLTKQDFIQWYTTVRLTIMDTTINDTTLYENALEKSFNRCMYVTVIFYRNKEIGLSSRHYKLTGILSEGQFIPIGIRNQWLL